VLYTSKAWRAHLELRHLRYFLAVAECGSFSIAAEQRLHTAQPSLSRQIRDLEYQVGADLLTRSTRGVELTPAGKVFLEHCRIVLAQVEAACVAARRVAQPPKPHFSLGFLTGMEMDWLPDAMHILKDELANLQVTVSSEHSPQLADALTKGTLDLAFLRHEPGYPELIFTPVAHEPLIVLMPSDHRLAGQKLVMPHDLESETFIGVSDSAPVLRAVITDFVTQFGLSVSAQHEVDNLSMAISLVASTRGIALLPLYANNFLPWSVVSRPIGGEAPTIELMLAYHKANTAPVLQRFVSKVDELISRVSSKHRQQA
jgi:LysR family transcriptional regulator, hca operon transcriptional activator